MSAEGVIMKPTMNLRFVEREMLSRNDTDGQILSHGFVRKYTAVVLQQLFVSVTSPDSEWRDVPIVAIEQETGARNDTHN